MQVGLTRIEWGCGLMRSVFAFSCLLACLIAPAPSSAAECPGNPNALGTSRTIVVDPREHNRLGSYQYAESLPLADKEVVLTFDDGPLPPFSTRILDILARECVKATFFMVGKMARTFPRVVRRAHEEGHTLASHSQNHPYNFHTMSVLDAAREIEDSFESIAVAVGDPAKVSPFFRFPGLHRQEAVERYLASKGRMTWSVDFMGDDWTRIGASEIVRRALHRLESKGKGMLMLHDIKPATAVGLQDLLDQLKARGYKVVHVVHATPDRPKTITVAEQWRVANPPTYIQLTNREPSMWPRTAPYRVAAPDPALEAPSIISFGANAADGNVPVTLVSVPEALRNGNGHNGHVDLPVAWPEEVRIAAAPEREVLPIPAAETFRYSSTTRARTKRDKNRSVRTAGNSSASADVTGSARRSTPRGSETKFRRTYTKTTKWGRSRNAGKSSGKRQTGHQIHIPKPTVALRSGR